MYICYDKLWKLLLERNIRKTEMSEVAGLNSRTLAKLSKNETVTTDTIARICKALHCDVGDIMEYRDAEKAATLVAALPYIQKYYKKTIVIKYGGNAMTSEELKEAVMGDIVLLSLIGIKVVLVHGGGPEISDMLKRTGKESRFVNGLRVTDAETQEIVQMVLAGKINKNLVNLLENAGGHAIGLCGVDGHMIEAKQLNPELGFVGEVTGVNTQPILDVLEKGGVA